MNAQYQGLRSQADRLYYRFNDVVNDKPAMAGIAADVRAIVEDCEMEKNPHSIEDRIKRVVEHLKDLKRDDSQPIGFGNVDELIRDYEELREHVRDMDNY